MKWEHNSHAVQFGTAFALLFIIVLTLDAYTLH